MQILGIILEKLRSENIAAYRGSDWCVAWKDDRGEEHCINERDVALCEDRLAWFQSNYHSQHLLRIFDSNYTFSWEPVTHNPVFGCHCLFIQWYQQQLIFIYQEKHFIYICSIEHHTVRTFDFHGDQINKRGDLVYFKNFGPDTGFIQRFDLPAFTLLDPITTAEANSTGIYPDSVDVIIGLEEK